MAICLHVQVFHPLLATSSLSLTSREASKSLHTSEYIIFSSEGSVSLCFNDFPLHALLIGTLSPHHVHTPQTTALLH
ncbi:hypothetical protein BX666DRAFT_1894767 [Dichotomocladium elegans]|nr:hypothetical protein BX666DRAFT_1894767 [Dichotomocladium elegans]